MGFNIISEEDKFLFESFCNFDKVDFTKYNSNEDTEKLDEKFSHWHSVNNNNIEPASRTETREKSIDTEIEYFDQFQRGKLCVIFSNKQTAYDNLIKHLLNSLSEKTLDITTIFSPTPGLENIIPEPLIHNEICKEQLSKMFQCSSRLSNESEKKDHHCAIVACDLDFKAISDLCSIGQMGPIDNISVITQTILSAALLEMNSDYIFVDDSFDQEQRIWLYKRRLASYFKDFESFNETLDMIGEENSFLVIDCTNSKSKIKWIKPTPEISSRLCNHSIMRLYQKFFKIKQNIIEPFSLDDNINQKQEEKQLKEEIEELPRQRQTSTHNIFEACDCDIKVEEKYEKECLACLSNTLQNQLKLKELELSLQIQKLENEKLRVEKENFQATISHLLDVISIFTLK